MNNSTVSEYKQVISACKEVFEKKMKDYGTAWRILRPSSITDQIFIKAKRIRSIQEKKDQKVSDSVFDDLIGMINYCLMALIQMDLKHSDKLEMNHRELESLYKNWSDLTLKLLLDKNHDYGEAWRDMRVSSIVDIILMKLLRIKQMEENTQGTLISEAIKSNYQDIINYSAFTSILLNPEKTKHLKS